MGEEKEGMDHVRSATRWVSIAVMINMLVVLVGLLTGGSLLVKLVGIEGPAAQAARKKPPTSWLTESTGPTT